MKDKKIIVKGLSISVSDHNGLVRISAVIILPRVPSFQNKLGRKKHLKISFQYGILHIKCNSSNTDIKITY